MKRRNGSFSWLRVGIVGFCTFAGAGSFLYPFFMPTFTQVATMGSIRSGDTPWVVTLVITACLLALLFEIQSQATNIRLIALLGVLVALNSALRFLEVAVPGPGGFSPVFFLIMLVGAVFGANMGFIMGALTLLVSALVTGGVGPWLPGQMFTAGWVGMSAAITRPLAGWIDRLTRRRFAHTEIGVLIVLGAVWGLLYGAIMNLWGWPFIAGSADQYWAPGVGFLETLQRYGAYYLVTSLIWDLARSAGNVLLLGFFGVPTLRALLRFKDRFEFKYTPGNLKKTPYRRK